MKEMLPIEVMLKSIDGIFERAFINTRYELILEPKHNIYFRLEDIETELDFKCKMIAWVSRSCIKGCSFHYQRYFTNRLRSFFKYSFDREDLIIVYTLLGNDVNRKLCEQYILSGFDIKILMNYERQYDHREEL